MALSIGLNNTHRIMVGENVLEILEVAGNHVTAQYNGEKYLITDAQRTKLAEGVFVSCGDKDHRRNDQHARLAFEAPRDVKIVRL